MGNSGMQVVFLNPTTMVFGQTDALKSALDARDGMAPNFLTNRSMLDQMQSVDSDAVWSVLDQEGTQTMMRSVLGDASQLTDYDTVKKRLVSSRYSMSFDNGVKFDLDVITPDTISAATMASLLNAAALYKKVSGTPAEKQAIETPPSTPAAGPWTCALRRQTASSPACCNRASSSRWSSSIILDWSVRRSRSRRSAHRYSPAANPGRPASPWGLRTCGYDPIHPPIAAIGDRNPES